MIEDRDEDDLTPVESPEAKRRSTGSLGKPHACPECKGKLVECAVCVNTETGDSEHYTDSALKLELWETRKKRIDQARDTDPAPSTERNDR